MARHATPRTLLALLCAGAAIPHAQNLFFGSAGFGGSQDALHTTDLNGGTPATILSGAQFLTGLEYEATTNRLYMINKGTASVAWMNPAGGPVTIVFSGSGQNLGEMYDIAALVPARASAFLLAAAGPFGARRRRPA